MRLPLLLPLLASALLSLTVAERKAAACSPVYPGSGYVTALQVTSILVDDPATPEACHGVESGCGPDTRYTGSHRSLFISMTVAETGAEDSYVSSLFTYELEDAQGNVLEKKEGSTNGTSFDQLGAKVCAITGPAPTDAGTDAGKREAGRSASRFCVPVTIPSLEVTAEDRAEHQASIDSDCGSAQDAGEQSGGCSVNGQSGMSFFGLAAFGAALAAARRRMRS